MRGKKAVEAKNLLTCANMVSTDYKDKYGNDRQSLIYATKTFFTYYKDIFIHIEKIEIMLDETKTQADVEIVALIVGRSKDNVSEKILEGLEGERDRFKIRLVKEEKQWRLLEIEFFEPLHIMGREVAKLRLGTSGGRIWSLI